MYTTADIELKSCIATKHYPFVYSHAVGLFFRKVIAHTRVRARARFIRSRRSYGLLHRHHICNVYIYNKSSSKSNLNSLSYTPMTALLCPHATASSSYVMALCSLGLNNFYLFYRCATSYSRNV